VNLVKQIYGLKIARVIRVTKVLATVFVEYTNNKITIEQMNVFL